MYSELLQQGKAIEIRKDGYTATTFRIIDGSVHYSNSAIGSGIHDEFSENIVEFDKHIINMLSEDFIITIF